MVQGEVTGGGVCGGRHGPGGGHRWGATTPGNLYTTYNTPLCDNCTVRHHGGRATPYNQHHMGRFRCTAPRRPLEKGAERNAPVHAQSMSNKQAHSTACSKSVYAQRICQIARNPAHHRRTMKSKCVPVTRVPCHRAPVKAKGHGMAAEQTVQQFTPTVLQYSCNIGKNKYSLQYSPHPQPIAVVACRKESLYHTPARQQEKNATTGCGCQGIPWGIPPPAVQHIRSSAHR